MCHRSEVSSDGSVSCHGVVENRSVVLEDSVVLHALAVHSPVSEAITAVCLGCELECSEFILAALLVDGSVCILGSHCDVELALYGEFLVPYDRVGAFSVGLRHLFLQFVELYCEGVLARSCNYVLQTYGEVLIRCPVEDIVTETLHLAVDGERNILEIEIADCLVEFHSYLFYRFFQGGCRDILAVGVEQMEGCHLQLVSRTWFKRECICLACSTDIVGEVEEVLVEHCVVDANGAVGLPEVGC